MTVKTIAMSPINLKQVVDDTLYSLNEGEDKKNIVQLLLLSYSEEDLFKGFVRVFEETNNPFYLSLIFFLPFKWLEKMDKENDYFLRLVKYQYFYSNPMPIKPVSFYKDTITQDVKRNILILTGEYFTKQPLILGNKMIDIGDPRKEPRIQDLISHNIIYDYELLTEYQEDILDYFHAYNQYKFEKMVSKGVVHSKWTFVSTVDEENWGNLLNELKELHNLSQPILKIPYQLKSSIVRFISIEKKLVEYTYEKDIELPSEVIENPSKIRTHLFSLARWHFQRRFRYVSFSFPHMDITMSGNKLSVLKGKILKELPYVNKNLLKSILHFSETLSKIRENYPLEYVQLELNNMATYEALRVLNVDNYSKFFRNLFELRKNFNQTGKNQVYSFPFLKQTMTYDCFSKFYYNILHRIKVYNQRDMYLLTDKAVNKAFSFGFHYVMRISLITDYLFNHMDIDTYKIFREKISNLIKENRDIEDIIAVVEGMIIHNPQYQILFYNDFEVDEDEDMDLLF